MQAYKDTNTIIVPNDIENFTSYCRVCLHLPESSQILDTNIVYDEEEMLTYKDVFHVCTQIDLLANKSLPCNLCKSCGLELQMAYDFYKKVEYSQCMISQIIEQIENQEEKTSIVTDNVEVEEVVDMNELSLPTQDNESEEHIDIELEEGVVIQMENIELPEVLQSDTAAKYNYTSMSDNSDSADEDTNNDDINNFENDTEEDQTHLDKTLTEDSNSFYVIEVLDKDDTETEIIHNSNLKKVKNNVKEKKIFGSTKSRYSRKLKKNGPPFECNKCDYVCQTANLLYSHRYRKHNYKKMHECTRCDKQFATADKLERHLQRPSCEPYPEFTCEHCSKICVGVANYQIHMRFHKKNYPFVCHLCAKGFMLATHLNNHVKVKHENQRYLCDHPGCGKMFQTTHALKTHCYIHATKLPFECIYCQHAFPNKGRLGWHINKKHGFRLSLDELEFMRVAENITVKPMLVTLEET